MSSDTEHLMSDLLDPEERREFYTIVSEIKVLVGRLDAWMDNHINKPFYEKEKTDRES